jgi:hypothetical protein
VHVRSPHAERLAGLLATLHGFVSLEHGFVHPVGIDRSFDRLVQGLITALAGLGQPIRHDTELNMTAAITTEPANPELRRDRHGPPPPLRPSLNRQRAGTDISNVSKKASWDNAPFGVGLSSRRAPA